MSFFSFASPMPAERKKAAYVPVTPTVPLTRRQEAINKVLQIIACNEAERFPFQFTLHAVDPRKSDEEQERFVCRNMTSSVDAFGNVIVTNEFTDPWVMPLAAPGFGTQVRFEMCVGEQWDEFSRLLPNTTVTLGVFMVSYENYISVKLDGDVCPLPTVGASSYPSTKMHLGAKGSIFQRHVDRCVGMFTVDLNYYWPQIEAAIRQVRKLRNLQNALYDAFDVYLCNPK